jgi:hypothetical protein
MACWKSPSLKSVKTRILHNIHILYQIKKKHTFSTISYTDTVVKFHHSFSSMSVDVRAIRFHKTNGRTFLTVPAALAW